ncbi:hypothetical protein A1O7_07726 [Cladophialophora yegresii CBS 114405]|uniref:Uncharacterized protein n=1 Tax=Cladophialophora yegresii CBS 114405 TaxID=1182544 RepID=W9WFT3_9EURO|nr:uncharacterized protein A1O7_07726 [Cladophialophora yegresii CBS 114405]EXJ57379.1 hypothetical protein A1O7_07726 [Cladophialophora yegresii CBS 114405]
MTNPNTTNSANLNNASNLQATAPPGQEATPDKSFGAAPSSTSAGDNKTSYTSSDPTTHPDAKPTSKIAGDLKGMAQGVAGSVQAAVGTTFGQKGMADKGFEKMSEEDARLAAKSGVPPVGTEQRDKVL